jgi:hypothetical protein
MITNTYDLNLYVIDGELKVLAHQLEFASDGHVQTGSEFQCALSFPVKRANRFLWEPILSFFEEEPELYNELDSWYRVALYDEDTPFCEWHSALVEAMPPIVATAIQQLPEYEMTDWR